MASHCKESWTSAFHYVFIVLLVMNITTILEAAKTGPSHNKVVVCYISTWAVYRPGEGAYSIENFDANLCTHAVYAFAGLDIAQAAIKSLDPWQDLKDEYGKGGYERLTSLKRNYPHLKVSLAIGGWNEGSKNYSLLVADSTLRGQFVGQVTRFIRKYNFDGLDLDWEYPSQRGGDSINDRHNFVLLTGELRAEFDKHNLILTSAIGAAKTVIDQAYAVRQLSLYLDFLHVMCYDYHGSWDGRVGYNAPLSSSTQDDVLTVEYTIQYLLKLGAPPNKLVLGLPFYGRTFKTALQGRFGSMSDGTGFQGPYTREDGFLGYNEICSMLGNKTSGWSTVWDATSAQMLAHSERDIFTGLVHVVTFDSARSLANKVRFALSQQLAGFMIWSIDTDDFLGECVSDSDIYNDYRHLRSTVIPSASVTKNYPLLRTINEAIPLALEDIEQGRIIEDNDVSDNEIPHGIEEVHKDGSNGSTKIHNYSSSTIFYLFRLLTVVLLANSHLFQVLG